MKTSVLERVGQVYDRTIFRRLRWYSFVNRNRYLDGVVNRIKGVFGDKKLVYGDFEGKRNYKGLVSSPGIGLKRSISKRISICNLDEFRTSCLDFKFENRCNNLYAMDDRCQRVKRVHSILTYKTESGRYGCIGRDLNAVRNMVKIVKEFLKDGTRPLRFRRDFKIDS